MINALLFKLPPIVHETWLLWTGWRLVQFDCPKCRHLMYRWTDVWPLPGNNPPEGAA